MSTTDLKWPILSRSSEREDHVVFSVRTHVAANPRTGAARTFHVIDSPGWINVVALTSQGDVVLVRQFRHGNEEVTTELPGGLVDPGESPLEAAKRELEEETGYVSAHWEALGVLDPNPAIQSNQCSVFLALEAEKVSALALDDGEHIEVVTRPLDEVPGMIRSREITHSLVIAAFFFFLDRANGWQVPTLTDVR